MADPAIAERYDPFIALNANLTGLPAVGGNSVDLLPDYPGSLARIAEEIEKAQYFAHIEYFIIAMDDATEACFAAMEQAAQRGVKVRVLLDDLGSRSYPHYKEMLARMTKAGIQWHLMLPLKLFNPRFTRPDLRNHRKIVVIDEVTLICYDKSVAAAIQPIFAGYLKRSKQVHLHEWMTRPLTARLKENLSRLTAALQ